MLDAIARYGHRAMFWHTPYRLGNLARSIGDVGKTKNGVGFVVYNANSRAPYGEILDKAATITRIVNGQASVYNNKHYNWVGRGADAISAEICLVFGVRRKT